ncbi:hypothetical protein ACXWRW_10595, partial [Streptococcus pyogenes]
MMPLFFLSPPLFLFLSFSLLSSLFFSSSFFPFPLFSSPFSLPLFLPPFFFSSLSPPPSLPPFFPSPSFFSFF